MSTPRQDIGGQMSSRLEVILILEYLLQDLVKLTNNKLNKDF